MIIDVWNRVLSNLEDCRAATILTSVDYSKAFNRLSFHHCLRAFEAHGASSSVLAFLATFLTSRTMSMRVGQSWSAKRPVNGGMPQGSILGVFLFNVSIDDLEDGCPDVDGEVVEARCVGGSPLPPCAALQTPRNCHQLRDGLPPVGIHSPRTSTFLRWCLDRQREASSSCKCSERGSFLGFGWF